MNYIVYFNNGKKIRIAEEMWKQLNGQQKKDRWFNSLVDDEILLSFKTDDILFVVREDWENKVVIEEPLQPSFTLTDPNGFTGTGTTTASGIGSEVINYK